MGRILGIDINNKLSNAPIPDTFKIGRQVQLQLSKVEKNLFAELEEKGKGGYIISGLPQSVSELDLSSFSFAVSQILYNQSYQCGNTDTNSGVDKIQTKERWKMEGVKTYAGTIVSTLNDLCRGAYGVAEPSTEQKKAMSTLIDTLHNVPTVWTYPDGSVRKSVACAKLEEFADEKTGAITYLLSLNPVFTMEVADNFAEFPQDFMFRLSKATRKKTAAHLKLARFLSNQDKRKPCIRTIAYLVQELGLESAYKKNKSRTEKQMKDLFDVMVKIGMLSDYTITEKLVRGRASMDKVTFILNEDFIPRPTKSIAMKKEEEG